MFRKNSSRLENRGGLRRSKSTGSVDPRHIRNLVSIEPHAAQRDAHIAARISFSKSRNESLTPNPTTTHNSLSSDRLIRSNSFMNGPDVISCSAEKTGTGMEHADSSLRRQRSVRFTGPNAVKKRDIAVRSNNSWVGNGELPHRKHPSYFAGNLPRSSPLDKNIHDFWMEDRSVNLDSRQDETLFGSESPVFPPPQRRLRKSRSMFNSSFMSSGPNTDARATAPTSWNMQERDGRMALSLGKHSLRSPKSMSFLRLQSSKTPSMRRRNDSDTPLSPSKGSTNGAAPLNSRPSLFFRSKNRRNDSLSDMKVSMRNSSNNSMPMPSTRSSTASSLSKSSGLRAAAKKVSRSVRSKLKGIFSRSKQNFEIGTASNDTETSSVHQSQTSLPEEAPISRVKSYVPSLRSATSDQYLQPRQGSFEIMNDAAEQMDGERSRVTSWTNSSTHTVVSSPQDVEWEPQRLSVINEGGNTACMLERWRSSEDEERAYSALVQRLDDMQKQQSREASTREGSSTCFTQRDMTASGSSISINTEINSQRLTSSESTQCLVENGEAFTMEYENSTDAKIGSGISSPTSHLFRTQSPYRKALRKSMRVQDRSSSTKPVNLRYLSSLSALTLPTRRSSPNGSEQDVHMSSAESIYSCQSDSQEIAEDVGTDYDLAGMDEFGAGLPQSVRENGDEVLEEEEEATPQREVSGSSSVEWKTWLSAKVSKLEDLQAGKGQSLGDEQTWNPWAGTGHVREDAQIEPTCNPSDSSDIESEEISMQKSVVSVVVPPPATQSIVIEASAARNSPRTLSYNENSNPHQIQIKDPEDVKTVTEAVLRTVTSLPNVRPSELDEATCRHNITPQKPKTSPFAVTESANKTKRPYLQSGAASSLKSSPGLTAAVRRQFGTIATGSPRRRSIRGGEDVMQNKTIREVASFDDCQFRKGLDAQAMGSKRMVELFLSSRKHGRQKRSHVDAAASEWPPAFV